jgi:hypothetical protein
MQIIMAALLLLLAAPGLAQFCEGEKSKQEAKEVSLLRPTDEPAFYFSMVGRLSMRRPGVAETWASGILSATD